MPRKLYCETRLYNVNDRIASLNLVDAIDSWIDEGLLGEMDHCFLPYRDNPIPPGTVDIGKKIFDMDVEELYACDGVVGNFDGPHYDSGCAFEVGLGFALGYPVNLTVTDYYRWSVGDDHQHFYCGSKLLEHVADLVLVPRQDMSIPDYRARTMDQIQRSYDGLKAKLIEDFAAVRTPVPLKALPVEHDYYIDPNFKYTESGEWLLSAIKAAIGQSGRTYVVGDNQGDIAVDLERLCRSGQAIFFADPFEPNVDTSILQGIAFGIGRKPVVYTGNRQWYDGGAQAGAACRGVMINNSAEKVVYSIKELEAYIAGR